MSDKLSAQLEREGMPSPVPTNTRVRIANGSTIQSIGVVNVPIQVEGSWCRANFTIVPSSIHELIIGMDVMREMEAEINTASGMVTFRKTNEWFSMTGKFDGGETEPRPLPNNKSSDSKTTVQHVIRLMPDATPIKQRYFPCNPKKQEAINREVEKMLEAGVIEPSQSPWSSPIVIVPKKSGETRFCVDFRKVNAVTIRDSYPLPYISHILDKLRGSKYFSTLDLKNGYWQIPLAAASRPITAFTIPGKGLYQFRRMPFGLHSAGATFQRYLDSIIGPDLDHIALVYLDDIIVLGETKQQHMTNLRRVTDRLTAAGLRLNHDKCEIAKTSIVYLGHVITPEGIKTDPDKIKAIKHIAPPRSKKEVRSLLGSASWYRRFVPRFAQITAPLVKLTKKDERWTWNLEQEEAFRQLKGALMRSPVLACPDFTKPFQLHTDASEKGIGAALIQVQDDQERVIAYASRTYNSAEAKYCTTEKECLAVVWGINKFRYYLEGYPFMVITDHQCLRWLAELQKPSGRLSRWAVDLQQYSFSIRYRSGAENTLADSLSRNPLPIADESEAANMATENVEPCTWYANKKAEVKKRPTDFPEYRIQDGQMYRYFPGTSNVDDTIKTWKLCVPKPQRKQVLEELHDPPEAGHLGITKTIARALHSYYWPGIIQDVRNYVRNCVLCKRHKFDQKRPFGYMRYSPVDFPWQQVSVDLMGPFPRSSLGNTMLLVVQDRFTKWVEMQPLRKASAKAILQVIREKVVYRFGCPKWILSDNGPQFASQQFKDELKVWGIRNRYNPPYSPQNNPVERVNRVVGPMLAQYVAGDHQSWDKYLPQMTFAINSAVHETTGFSPAMLNFGREMSSPGSYRSRVEQTDTVPELPPPKELWTELGKLRELNDIVRVRLAEGYQRQSRAYNLRRRPFTPQVGQWVYHRAHHLSSAGKKFSAKLANKYHGPSRIIQVESPNIVLLQPPQGRRPERVHVRDLKEPQPQDTPPIPLATTRVDRAPGSRNESDRVQETDNNAVPRRSLRLRGNSAETSSPVVAMGTPARVRARV